MLVIAVTIGARKSDVTITKDVSNAPRKVTIGPVPNTAYKNTASTDTTKPADIVQVMSSKNVTNINTTSDVTKIKSKNANEKWPR